MRKGSAHADPFAEQKNACAATWGTWIDGTGCTWPVTSGSVTKNTSSKAEDSKQSDPVVDELTMLRNNVEKATKALATAIATRDNAIVARDAAKDALREAQSTLLTSKETMEARKAALAQAESLLEIANTNLSNLQSQYEEAVSAAQSEYDKTMAQAALERDGELAENAKVYADAVKAADDAFNATLAELQSDYDQAVKDADAIRDGEYADIETAVAKAKADALTVYTDAVAKADAVRTKSIEDAVAEHNLKLEDAKKAYDAAVEAAKNDPEYKAACDALDAAIKTQSDAVKAKQETADQLEAATEALDTAKSEKEAADALVAEKKQAHDDTVTALNDANQKLAEAEATLASATTNRGEAEKAVETAKANVATAKSNLDQANNDLTEANKAKDVAKNRLADATAAIDSAQKAVEAAQAKINEGALGFYESMAESDPLGSQRAISMLNKAATTDKLADNLKTKIGAEGDATSLENVKKALDIIVVGNQMHVTDNNNPGLPDWRITNTSMAASQVHANAETDGAGHLMFTNYEADSAIGSVPEAEVSAWGYGTDPYRGWYTEEKQVYDYKTQYYKEHGTWPTKEEIAKALGINVRWVQTGHYIIVTGKYEYVGLGYNTSKENYLRNTAVSNLDSNRAMDVIDGKEVYENSYTIDEYRALFDAYYNEVMSALTNAQNDLTAKQDALKALQATDGLTSEEQQAITNAQAAVEAAQEKYDALNTTLSEAVDAQSLAKHNELVAQIGVDKAVEAKTEAANAETDAKADLTSAETDAQKQTRRLI